MPAYNYWDTEIKYLKKVGPKRAEILTEETGIRTFRDLLHFFPRKYIDKSHIYRISELQEGLPQATLTGKIVSVKLIKGGRARRFTAKFRDESGEMELVWFKGVSWIQDIVKPGMNLILFGHPGFYGGKPQMAHPEMELLQPDGSQLHNRPIVPQYPGTEKLQKYGMESRAIRDMVHQMLEGRPGDILENIPPEILNEYSLIPRAEAFTNIHFPDSFEQLTSAKRRLVFEELFFFQLMLAEKKAVIQPQNEAFPFPTVGEKFNRFYHEFLPFQMTNAQKKVLKQIRADLGKSVQMNRLIQGDVGSGKTIVAFLSCLIAIDNDFQAAVMAPTEILAEQHFRSFHAFANPIGVNIALLTGSTKKSERDQLLLELRNGFIHILIGTHALIEDRVEFMNLGFTVVDEQHKFGVLQRAALWAKGKKHPHNMVMTATPIPRTLGMTVYGDLEVSVINELPPGRTPVKTIWRTERTRLEVFGKVRRELQKGRQAYFVYPLVEESEKLDYLAVTAGHEAISKVYPEYRVGIVHGRQKSADKEYEMRKFKEGHYHIMVATTVIEVGVDVPNATVMVIENAERFGLSQLHQLRGRVGRGAAESFCYVMAGKKLSADARKRLGIMVDTNDGFKIAEEDMRLRGPGDFLGTRQSGLPEFRLANILEDHDLLVQARTAAFQLVAKDPNLEDRNHKATRAFFGRYMKNAGGLGSVL